MDPQQHTPVSGIWSILLFAVGWIFQSIEISLETTDQILGIILKVFSILSFAVGMMLGIMKIKDRLKG